MENFSNNMQITDLQSLLNFVNLLKNKGEVWNDAEFCQKCGFPRSYLSDLKAGRKVLNEQLVRKIMAAFPDFFAPKKVDMTDPLGDLIALARYNMERGHDEVARLIAIIEKREGMEKKEKTA